MSHYIERLCVKHGEWEDDVDCPSECPSCLKEGIAESQIAAKDRAELAALKAENAELQKMAVHSSREGTNFYYKDAWEAAQAENARLRAALEDAAKSLAWISVAGGRYSGIADLVDVRGYASSRAREARAALSGAPAGVEAASSMSKPSVVVLTTGDEDPMEALGRVIDRAHNQIFPAAASGQEANGPK